MNSDVYFETRLELDGLTFQVQHVYDQDKGAPWQEADGHGIISDWTTRPKRPNERVLASDRDSRRYYDIGATLEKARNEGWGIPEDAGMTRAQILAEAVERDFHEMKAWCDDEWHWTGVVVTLLDVHGNPIPGPDARESLWGIESNAGAELDEVALECAAEIARRFAEKDEVCLKIRR